MEINGQRYVIKKAEISQLSEIQLFLHEHFDHDETMMKSMRAKNTFTKEEAEAIKADYDIFLRALLEQSLCLLAINEPTGEIIGCNLMMRSENPKYMKEGNESAMLAKNHLPSTPIVREYFKYVLGMKDEANLFEKFPNARACVEFCIIGVHRNYRRRGLAQFLMVEGISFVKSIKDVGFVYGIYTSLYSKKAAQNLGLRNYLDVDITQYKNAEGKRIFHDTEPHNIISVLAMEV